MLQDITDHVPYNDASQSSQLFAPIRIESDQDSGVTSTVCTTHSSSQSKEEDDYDDCQDSEGYISCCENKGTPILHSSPQDHSDFKREVRVCNLCELELIKRSSSELDSAGSEVFAGDFECDDCHKALPLNHAVNSSPDSRRIDGSNPRFGFVNPQANISETNCNENIETVLWSKKQINRSGYLETVCQV